MKISPHNKVIIDKETECLIVGNATLSVTKLVERTGLPIGVIKRVLKENGISKYKVPKIPAGAIKKEWFNFDVYSSGHLCNRNTGKWTNFKVTSSKRGIEGKNYLSVEKKSPIYINHNGVKKTITISQARLIAILFVPNPNNYQNVRFKNGGKFNCDSNNLEWSDKHPMFGRVKVMPKKLYKMFSEIKEDELHKSDKVALQYFLTKDILHIYNFFKEEKRYYWKIMIDVYKSCSKAKNASYSIIEDILNKFIEDLPGLIDRGYFIPKQQQWFLLYCREHLKGRIKNFIYRQAPKQKYFDELSMPTHLLTHGSNQKHNFA